MRNREHRTAFSESFLDLLQQRSDTHIAQEADLSGPWEVRATPEGYAVARDLGDIVAIFSERQSALLTAAVLPAVGMDPLWGLRAEQTEHGFPLETRWGDRWVISAGYLSSFDPAVVEALHIVDSLIRSPRALAMLLEAAGSTTLQLAGRYLAERFADADVLE